MNYEQLQSLCGDHEKVRRPLRIDAAGKRWAMATTGTGLLAVVTDEFDLAEPTASMVSSVPTWIDQALQAETVVDWEPLKAFVGSKPERTTCDECGGGGECPHCGAECESCYGDGFFGPPDDIVCLFGRPFNATLVAKFLEHAEAATVRVVPNGGPQGRNEGPILIADADGRWVVSVMPMLDRMREHATRAFPPEGSN